MNEKARILVVDDDEQILMVWHGALNGYAKTWCVHVTRNGLEALKMLKQDRYDLLVTDLKMPEMNGYELTRTAQILQPNMPVIWITSFPYVQTECNSESLDIFCCLKKPVSINEIRATVLEALSR